VKVDNTSRGFSIIEFIDRYNAKCSLQKSSLATEDAIWLGVEDAKPQIMAHDAAKHNVETKETTGWVPYPIPEEVLLTTRMHLTQDMVNELLPYLISFVRTGDLEEGLSEDINIKNLFIDMNSEHVKTVVKLQTEIETLKAELARVTAEKELFACLGYDDGYGDLVYLKKNDNVKLKKF